MSVDSMPSVPNEAFGVFLSSSPPAVNALASYCVLWEGAGLRLPQARRAGRGHIVSRHVPSPATTSATSRQESSRENDVNVPSYVSATATYDLNQPDWSKHLLIERSSPIRLPCATKPKKRVTFADNLGFDLEDVKVICEEPNSPPPELCMPAGSSVSTSSTVEPAADASAVQKPVETFRQPSFRVDFPQPVSNYAEFKARLLARCIAVENVNVESMPAAAARVVVTVKVKNLAFEKRVFLRATRNGWKSHRDFDATFLGCNPGCGDAGGLQSQPTECAYDTFVMKADLAGALHASGFLSPIEFAVCYQASGGHECWDNNGGSNYRLVANFSGGVPDAASGGGCGSSLLQRLQQATEPTELSSDRWTAYAAWRSGRSSGDIPYW